MAKERYLVLISVSGMTRGIPEMQIGIIEKETDKTFTLRESAICSLSGKQFNKKNLYKIVGKKKAKKMLKKYRAIKADFVQADIENRVNNAKAVKDLVGGKDRRKDG